MVTTRLSIFFSFWNFVCIFFRNVDCIHEGIHLKEDLNVFHFHSNELYNVLENIQRRHGHGFLEGIIDMKVNFSHKIGVDTDVTRLPNNLIFPEDYGDEPPSENASTLFSEYGLIREVKSDVVPHCVDCEHSHKIITHTNTFTLNNEVTVRLHEEHRQTDTGNSQYYDVNTYTLHAKRESDIEGDLNPSKNDNITIYKLIKPFEEFAIKARVLADTRHDTDGCLQDSSFPNYEKKSEGTPTAEHCGEDSLEKMTVMLCMALKPLFENSINLLSRGERQELQANQFHLQKSPKMLLYWENMRKLQLSRSELSQINEDYFKMASNVEELDLSCNRLKRVADSMRLLSNLRYLNISWNPIEDLHHLSDVLSDLRNLVSIDLSGINIGNLDLLLPGLNQLRLSRIILQDCHLKSLDSKETTEFFRNQASLLKISLSGNMLTSIAPGLFQNLKYLQYIDLSNNEFTYGLGLKVHELIELDLSGNQLKSPENILSHGGVYRLNLKGNDIESWNDSDIFLSSPDSPRLLYLNLAQNKIKILNKAMIKSFESLLEVDLRANLIHCSGFEAAQLLKWLQSEDRPSIYKKERSVTCKTPAVFEGLPVLALRQFRKHNEADGLKLSLPYLLFLILLPFIVMHIVYYKVPVNKTQLVKKVLHLFVKKIE